MRSIVTLLFTVLMVVVASTQAARAGQYATWNDIAAEMCGILDDSGSVYDAGDIEKAKTRVNDAYFGLYEKMGFERHVMSYISGKRVSVVEYKFSHIKKRMTQNAPKEEIRAELALLNAMLREDADLLDGKTRDAPAENEEFIVPTEEEIRAFDAAVSPEGLTPEEFEERKKEYILEMRRIKEEGK